MPKVFGSLAMASVLLLPSFSFAQSASANLTGTIRDASGGVLPGVSVTARNVATNETRSTVSETDGLYRITSVPRGTYEVKAELQPGASSNPGNAVLGGSAGGNTAFVNGQSNRANNFLLDGTDNNDQFTAGRTAVNPNVDLIQEFRLSTNNFSAEFGRNSASAVNVVTKSGSNQLHGTAYEFLRNDAFDSKSILAPRKDPLRFNQFGATNGGPVAKNKLFYFVAYEGLRLDRGTTLIRTVETPQFRQLVAQRFPNSIANFLFSQFPSPAPTSNIRDLGQPVTGTQTQNILNDPNVGTNPNYIPTGG